MVKKNKTPWPTKAVMHQIYQEKLWGGSHLDFYSGTGSHDPLIIKPYINKVTAFLKAQNSMLQVCDLGCGDFNIGKHFVNYTQQYVALDIVAPLIDRNKKLYKNKKLTFDCVDIAKGALPKADCIILRQVLQHLSNKEIYEVVKKLVNYKYIILTEHVPVSGYVPNLDMISSQGIRLKKQSGVNLLAPPFNLKVKSEEVLHRYVLDNNKGCILTLLYTVF